MITSIQARSRGFAVWVARTPVLLQIPDDRINGYLGRKRQLKVSSIFRFCITMILCMLTSRKPAPRYWRVVCSLNDIWILRGKKVLFEWCGLREKIRKVMIRDS
jgi:hypothetical protein